MLTKYKVTFSMQTFLSFFRFSLIWKFCNADEALAAWIAASAIGFGPLVFSVFNFLSFCVTSNWIVEISICDETKDKIKSN